MSAQFYQYEVGFGVFTATGNPSELLESSTGTVVIHNYGPEVVYANRVLKSNPQPITFPNNQVFPILPGRHVELPADTGVDPWRLSFTTAIDGASSTITVAVGD